MKPFFSIEFKHKIDGKRTHHLSLHLANTQEGLLRNNRILIRQSPGFISCFIEDDEMITSEIYQLYFWVICTHDEFYQYTDFPSDTVFSDPLILWSNAEINGSQLHSSNIEDLLDADELQVLLLDNDQNRSLVHQAGKPPRNAIGCIALEAQKIEMHSAYYFEFDTKKTVWRYHINPRKPLDSWTYKIVDTKNEWNFDPVKEETQDWITFQSREPIAYQSRASDRLTLKWDPSEELRFEEGQQMTLPFANYAHKTIDGDKTETTPIYIHI